MKKAKIILMAIGVLAIVGGTLAFKARNAAYLGNLKCTFAPPNPPGNCPLTTYTTSINGTLAWCKPLTASCTVPCTLTRVVFHP